MKPLVCFSKRLGPIGRGLLYYGGAWNTSSAFALSEDLTSVGIGVVASPIDNLDISVFWGYPFRDLPAPGDNLQDSGISFSITLHYP